jgi:fibronectin type 3 domain-containing protein
VALSWQASASSIMGYNVYRGTNHGGPYAKINPELEPATVYTDHTVAAGTTYYYVVTSVDAAAESVYSNEIVAAIPSP